MLSQKFSLENIVSLQLDLVYAQSKEITHKKSHLSDAIYDI